MRKVRRDRKDLRDNILMGVEEEYSIFLFGRRGEPYSHSATESIIRSALQERLRGESLPFLEGHGGHAVFSGARIYWDRIGEISAAEYSTPEFRNPLDGCAYVQAGRNFYRSLADGLEAQGVASSMEVHLPGPCLSTGHANGRHLNFYRAIDRPITELVSHLTSHACCSGSGGWSVRPTGTLEFVRSPRIELISRVHGADSSNERPLIDHYRKNYGLGRRVQELSSDAGSMLQLYVRLGSTALLLAMVDSWQLFLDDLAPVQPLTAMRIWNRDPSVTVRVENGQEHTAFSLQQQLIDRVRAEIDEPQGPVPEWAVDVIASWQRLLDAARDPAHADCVAIDWMLHEGMLKHVCVQQKLVWESLPAIAQAYGRLAELQNSRSPEHTRDQLRGSEHGQRQIRIVSKILDEAHVEWPDFERAATLQPILHLASTRLSEIGRGVSAVIAIKQRERIPGLTDELINGAITVTV